MFHKFNSSDLYELLKFCTFKDIHNLKLTCKILYDLIPCEWIREELYIIGNKENNIIHFLKKTDANIFIEDDINKFETIKKFLFCERMFIAAVQIRKLIISNTLLEDLSIISCSQLTTITINNTHLLNNIFLNNLPLCSTINMSNNISPMRIHIQNCNVLNFPISPSWVNLKSLTLINVSLIREYIIPKTCENIQYIDISRNENLSKLYIYSDLRSKCIIKNYFTNNISIYTSEKNILCNLWITDNNFTLISI